MEDRSGEGKSVRPIACPSISSLVTHPLDPFMMLLVAGDCGFGLHGSRVRAFGDQGAGPGLSAFESPPPHPLVPALLLLRLRPGSGFDPHPRRRLLPFCFAAAPWPLAEFRGRREEAHGEGMPRDPPAIEWPACMQEVGWEGDAKLPGANEQDHVGALRRMGPWMNPPSVPPGTLLPASSSPWSRPLC